MKATVCVNELTIPPGIVVDPTWDRQVGIGAEMTQGYMVYRSFVEWDFG